MNVKMMGKFLSQIIAIEAVFMIPALLISLFCGETAAVNGFLWTLGIMLLLAGGLYLSCRKAGRLFGAREGLVCVGFSWMMVTTIMPGMPVVSAFPMKVLPAFLRPSSLWACGT